MLGRIPSLMERPPVGPHRSPVALHHLWCGLTLLDVSLARLEQALRGEEDGQAQARTADWMRAYA